MANGSRQASTSTIIHSDHGSQFTSWGFTENVRHYGLMGSMGTIGDCYDNAPMESFWGSMQIELLNRQKWRTKIELSIAMADYIVHFYKRATSTQLHRLHDSQRIQRPTLSPEPNPNPGPTFISVVRQNGV